ncbi:MAG: leucine-rich repeat protein [Polaribacter sp.]|uniref:leucine-rich repeat protein n=1 Tax=Polaribacter sp. TaxID=1920175 RepID=UPI003EF247E5
MKKVPSFESYGDIKAKKFIGNGKYLEGIIKSIAIADENGVTQFEVEVNEQLNFKNFTFDVAGKTVIAPTPPIQSYANLILGGLGSTVNTPTQIIALFQQYGGTTPIVEVVGSDTYVYIDSFYYFKNGAFIDNTLLTYFVDKRHLGNLNGISIFDGCINLEYVEISSPIYFAGKSLFDGCVNLSLTLDFVKNLKTMESFVFRGIVGDLSQSLYLSNITEIVTSEVFNGGEYVLNMPNLKKVTQYKAFHNFKGILNAPLLDDIGDPSVNTNSFYQIDSSAVVNVNYKLKTANNGSPDADLVYVESRGATVNYVGYEELFTDLDKLFARQFADDAAAAASNIVLIGEPYVNSTTGAIHLRLT